MKTQDHTKR